MPRLRPWTSTGFCSTTPRPRSSTSTISALALLVRSTGSTRSVGLSTRFSFNSRTTRSTVCPPQLSQSMRSAVQLLRCGRPLGLALTMSPTLLTLCADPKSRCRTWSFSQWTQTHRRCSRSAAPWDLRRLTMQPPVQLRTDLPITLVPLRQQTLSKTSSITLRTAWFACTTSPPASPQSTPAMKAWATFSPSSTALTTLA